METTDRATINVLKTITTIAKRLENSELKAEIIQELDEELNRLSHYLDTTKQQAMIFAVIFAIQIKVYSVELRIIVNFLDINYIDSLNFKPDFDILIDKNLIEIEYERRKKMKKSNFGKSSFIINSEVSDFIYANEPILMSEKESLDIYSFVNKVSGLIDKRLEESIDTSDLFNTVEELELINHHLTPLWKYNKELDVQDRTLLYEIIDDHIKGYPSSLDKTLKDIYDNNRKRLMKARELFEKTNKLFDLELITLSDSKYANDANLNLTNVAIELFMQEDADLFMKQKKYKNAIFNEDIVAKELFYDCKLAEDVSFLTNSLQNENFQKLQSRMSEMSLSKGVACIFYGSPGTGKTETAYQIAKSTGRDIMLVDISQTKSMWFGESEKRIKDIFDSYRRVTKSVDKLPILLFNEADAILNQRKENTHSNTSGTENAIQNILLEELERFEGIMIATTNLAGNLDTAYERRFLFKIKFEAPTTDVKSKIWMNKLSWIESEFAQQLSKEFSFSGGEIDNIVRKVTMKQVLTGNRPDSSEIYCYCQSEKMLSNKKGKVRVGFE
jgi:AAA+ superfamily predicted ATPase